MFFLLSNCFKASAQTEETDSLIHALNRTPEDTNKVHLYWKVGASMINQDAKTALSYFKKGTVLAEKLHFLAGLEKCQSATSYAFSLNAEYDSALIYINYAVPLAIRTGNVKRIGLAYLNRADVYNNLQNFEAALKDCDSAVKYSELAKSRDGVARIYSIIAGIYVSQKQYDKAFPYMDKAEKIFVDIKNIRMVALMYSEKAELYIYKTEPEKAVPLMLRALHLADSLQDIENLSAYYNTLSDAYVLLKRYKEAEQTSILALRYSEQTENVRQSAVVYTTFQKIYEGVGNIPKAIEYGLKAYKILVEEQDLLREHEVAAQLAEAYKKAGNTEEAYKFLKISKDLNDSLVKQQFNNETVRLTTSFHVSQQDKEIQLLNKDSELQKQRIQKQRLLMIGAFLLVILALVGIWLLMNRNKLRQRMKELELRNRIAADLHDEVGSSLSSIHMLSQIATQQQPTDSKHKEILSRMSNNAKETMEKMGDIVWMIKPGETEGMSLKHRMERFAYEICSAKNIDLSLNINDLETAKLNMDQRKNLYLIFKEAVNNAVKYSNTEKIDVSVRDWQGGLVLAVTDFGNGFDADAVSYGNGLENMQNRAAELGGTLNIESKAGEGTTVRLSVSL